MRMADLEEKVDWNFEEGDHEGEMIVSQLHRIKEISESMLEFVGREDEFPGWVQYKIDRAFSDMNDVFSFMEPLAHESGGALEEARKKKKGGNGLWANIHARRSAGKPRKKPGQKGYPKTLKIEQLREIIEDVIKEELRR